MNILLVSQKLNITATDTLLIDVIQYDKENTHTCTNTKHDTKI